MITLRSLVLLAGTATLLSACGNSDLNRMRGELIKACASTGQHKSVCTCAVDKLQDKYGENEMVRIYVTNDVHNEFVHDNMSFLMVCAGRNPLPPFQKKVAPAPAPAAQSNMNQAPPQSPHEAEFGPAQTRRLPPGDADYLEYERAMNDPTYVPSYERNGIGNTTTAPDEIPPNL